MRNPITWARETGRPLAEPTAIGRELLVAQASHALISAINRMRLSINGKAPLVHGLEDEWATAVPLVPRVGAPPARVLVALLASLSCRSPSVAEDEVLLADAKGSDITRHYRPLRHMQLRVEELASANRRKDEFLAALSHELRSPLAAIRHAVYLLGSEMSDAPARQRAQALIERQVRQMTRLVEDSLEVSRITTGGMQLQRERIDLRVIVSEAIETLEPEIHLRHHHLTVTLPDSPVWLQGDPDRLEQVLVNLLGNASKYTDPGGELAVRMHTQDGQAIVQVRDSGIGIAADALPHIFDLFNRANEAQACCKAGLGIGLALVRPLVELHGGSVTAFSAGPGRGSEFTVRLPVED
ncbi:MAG: HAMP domain-containing sensor histidine kinase [Steroidobacteraceae bacterium]